MDKLLTAIVDKGDAIHIALALLVSVLLWVIREQHKVASEERKRMDAERERYASERMKAAELHAASYEGMRNAVTTLQAHMAALRRTV